MALLAARHPEWRESALQREADYELLQDPEGSWAWRHHIGNLSSAEDSRFDDVTLWEELMGLANPAFVIHGAHSGRLTPADLRDLERRARRVKLVTIPGVAEDVEVLHHGGQLDRERLGQGAYGQAVLLRETREDRAARGVTG